MVNLLKYYEILEVNPGASTEEIRQAYKDQVKIWHPDRFQNDPRLKAKAQERLKEINEAYNTLKNYCLRPGGPPSPQPPSPDAPSSRPTGGNRNSPPRPADGPPPPPPPPHGSSTTRSASPDFFAGTSRTLKAPISPLSIGCLAIVAMFVIAVIFQGFSRPSRPMEPPQIPTSRKATPSYYQPATPVPTAPPAADRWLPVGQTSAGTTWDVDRQTLKKGASGELDLWLRKRPSPSSVSESAWVGHYFFKCATREYQRVVSGSSEFSLIPPGTMIEVAFDRLCKTDNRPRAQDRWLPVGKSTTGAVWDVDKRTMQKNAAGEVDLWVRKVPSPNSVGASFVVVHYVFRCASREYREVDSRSTGFAIPPAGTMIGAALDNACKAVRDLEPAREVEVGLQMPTGGQGGHASHVTKDFFAVGCTRDEVLSIQGTPDKFDEDTFHYGASEVHFENGRVRNWENYGALKVYLPSKRE